MVGAVGIENNNTNAFKDLWGMQGHARSLKGNNRGCIETLTAPLKRPRSLLDPDASSWRCFSRTEIGKKSASGQIFRHGWQADILAWDRATLWSLWFLRTQA